MPISWANPVASYSDRPKPLGEKGQPRTTWSSPRGGGNIKWWRTQSVTPRTATIYSIMLSLRVLWLRKGTFQFTQGYPYLHSRSISIMKSWTWYKRILPPHARLFYREGRKCHIYHEAGYELNILGLVTQKNGKGLESDCLAGLFQGSSKGFLLICRRAFSLWKLLSQPSELLS